MRFIDLLRALPPRKINPSLLAFGLGLVGLGIYAGSIEGWRVFASTLIVTLASVAAGALLGFLFALPRTVDADPDRPTLSSIRANTNLEKVSDWLTTILVGVTLIQLGNIRAAAARLFDSLGPAFGGQPDSAIIAGVAIVYFSILGFLTAWVVVRLTLGKLMARA